MSSDRGFGHDEVVVERRQFNKLIERIEASSVWTIEKRRVGEKEPYEISTFEGNLLLNAGINELWLLVIGGAGTAYDNATARLGVGDSNAAAVATQTALQAAVNKFWQGMAATYPTSPPASQQVVFRGVFADGDAQYAWEEFTVVNAANDAGENLNRKVSAQGTKAAGQEWTLTLTITLS